MSSSEQEPIKIAATPVSAEDASWLEHQRKERQETVKRLEEAAKYLSGLASVCLTILLGPNKDVFSQFNHSPLLRTGVLCWLGAVLLTLTVVFPFPYRYVQNSASDIRRATRKVARIKYALLILGALLFLVGISMLALLYLGLQRPDVQLPNH
jgi:ABC-type molybdate transport system permease subunit